MSAWNALKFWCFVLTTLAMQLQLSAQDWPMWRYDAQRSAASQNQLPDSLELVWQKSFGKRKQVWDDPLNLDLMTYDRLFEPIVLDGRMILGFNDADKVMALDASTGQELWTFYTEGPVRLPAAGWMGHVYFTSDDGYLYCVDAESGDLSWKFSAAPNSQHAIGNGRLTSAWPARGGPVIRDGIVYFASSIWPFMGTFIQALDAKTGEVRWVNDSTGSHYIKQPHSAPSFAGVAPQGALAATKSMLIVPGGRSVPAVFDRESGKLEHFELNAGGKGTGGSFVAVSEKRFFVHTRGKGTRAFSLSNGVKTAFMPNEPVLHQSMVYSAELDDSKHVIRAYNKNDKLAWEIEADGTGDLILAGDKLVAAGTDQITIIQLPSQGQKAKRIASLPIDVKIERLLVANSTLFAVSADGRILAFGKPSSEKIANTEPADILVVPTETERTARELLSVGDATGYAFWYGDSEDLRAIALAIESKFVQLAIVDPDSKSCARARARLDDSAMLGSVTVHNSDPASFRPPSYVANMVFVDAKQSSSRREIQSIYSAVRPYGGVMYLLTHDEKQEIVDSVSEMNLEQADISIGKHGVIVRRQGALPGSADWTHQYGDIANTSKSDDRRVKLPLGILWYGGNSNTDVLPRHGHGPPEQVVGGRLFIQGMNSLSARDVYTGRVLWKKEFDDLGTFDVFYDKTYEDVPLNTKYNQVHIPGANARGTNYVVSDDRVYLLEGNVCHALDPATGESLNEFLLPKTESALPEQWGYLGVYDDVLIGGLGFAMYGSRHGLEFQSDKDLKASRAGFGSKSYNRAASQALVGFDRHSGKVLWKVDANHSFWHNGIVAGDGKIYCLDRVPLQVEDALRRRGKPNPKGYRILAIDSKTGKQAWSIDENIFGTWLGYSDLHNVLLQAGANASDRLYGETNQGMAVYAAQNGKQVWHNDSRKYSGPCILHNDWIITNANSYSESAGAFHLMTGDQKQINNPLTGESQPWTFTRAYGCNSIIASENMLTFRSGAAGFYDLLTDTGTGNLGGFKSGCTSNLVVANGVLNAPDYTRTCSCAYQNQTSLALVHMPEIETWSVNSAASDASHGKQIKDLAINFGAPGDHRDADGTLWLEHPVVAGPSPAIGVHLNPEAEFYRRHSSTMPHADRPWMLSSGVQGIADLRIQLKLKDEYDLRNGIPVEHANDDAEENENGKVDLKSSDLELIHDSGVQLVGMRFNKISVPGKTKIRSAHIQFTCDEPSKEDASLIITAEAIGNAPQFTNARHDLSSRTPTSHEVGWQPGPWKKVGDNNSVQRTPDLSALVQSVVDRPDWAPGNSIVFLISGVGKRVAASSKAGNPKAAKLIIDAESMKSPETEPAKRYEVDLYFAAPNDQRWPSRIFEIRAQGNPIETEVAIGETNNAPPVHVRLDSVEARDELHLEFFPGQGTPVLSGIKIHRLD